VVAAEHSEQLREVIDHLGRHERAGGHDVTSPTSRAINSRSDCSTAINTSN
jgi:hypothetical protein